MNLYKKYGVSRKKAKPGDLIRAAQKAGRIKSVKIKFHKKKSYKIIKDNKLKYFGETDTRKKTIRINKKKAKKTRVKGELIDSIVHERQHALHPRMSEKKVRERTLLATKRMSKQTKGRLYKKLT